MRGYNTTCVKIAHYLKHDKNNIQLRVLRRCLNEYQLYTYELQLIELIFHS